MSTAIYAQITNNLSGYDLFHYFTGCCLNEIAELEACVEWVMYERGLWQCVRMEHNSQITGKQIFSISVPLFR